ncbi:GPI mannosyltransferase 2 [Linum perenne]
MAGSTKQASNRHYPHQTLVVKCAIASRIILLALIFLWRNLVSSYDTSSPLNPDCLSSHHQGNDVLLPRIASAIENSVVWDSVYFVRIAQCGYEYEQTYAFFPLLPALMSLLSRTVLAPLVPLVGFRAVLALGGYAVNNVAFVLAAVYLYRLSVMILDNPKVALQASVLFCFNPASVFYSSIYTESLYSLSSLGGLYHLISGASTISVLWFALSACARSNGVLNAGYFCFQTMHQVYDAAFLKKRASLAVQVLVLGVLRCVCIFAPFIAFQAYGYRNLCLGHGPDETRPWCKAKIPLLYNYIQGRYWYVQLRTVAGYHLGIRVHDTLLSCSYPLFIYSFQGSRVLEIFPIQTVAKLSPCISNFISSSLLHSPLCDLTPSDHLLTGISSASSKCEP